MSPKEPMPHDLETRPASKDIELHAGHVEIEGAFNRLSLSKGVELTVNRYRVTADQLTLERSPQGILVAGDGRVSFCPCASSPFSVGFSKATVAPPTDLLLRQATFRACGVPVFWLPAYWVRSPNKVGLLTPKFGWRAVDGPWIGTGAHVPLSPKADAADGVLDVLAGAYLLGGVDLSAQLRTPRTLTLARWDHRDASLFELDTRGYRHFESSVSFTWQADALRGRRGKTGPVGFDAATRSYDRARAELAYSDGRTLYAVGLHADIPRATSFSEIGQFGPSARWGIGSALGDVGRVDSALVVLGHMRRSDTTNLTAIHTGDIAVDLRPGPLTVRWVNRERWMVGSGSAASFDAGLLGTEVRVGLPLVRRFGAKPRVVEHWLEPLVLGTAALRGYGSAYGQSLTQPIATAQVGLMNRLWSDALATNGSLELRAGAGAEAANVWHAIAGRWLASGTWIALGGEVGWGGSASWMSTLRARLGRVDKFAIRSRLEGRGVVAQSSRIQWLLDAAWSPWWSQWFARSGWISATEFDVALGGQVALSGGVSYDVGSARFMAQTAGAAYRHPCGCFAAATRIDRRIGRDGTDVVLLLELMP